VKSFCTLKCLYFLG